MREGVLVLSSDAYHADSRLGIHRLAAALSDRFAQVTVAAVPPGTFAPASTAELWWADGPAALPPDRDRPAVGLVQRLWSKPSRRPGSGAQAHSLDVAAARAALIVVQAGPAAALLPRLRRHAPRAEIVYYADMPVAGATRRGARSPERIAAQADRAVVTARAMAPHFAAFGDRVAFIPPGLDLAPEAENCPSPYRGPLDVAALAPARFDAAAIHIAATSFPEAQFHLIGATGCHRYPSNVHDHGVLRPADAIPFLRHARTGIVAYAEDGASACVADASRELATLGHFGVPAACPVFAAGDRPLRIGYDPGRSASIRAAMQHALRAERGTLREAVPTWGDVVDRILAASALTAPRLGAPDFRGDAA